MTWRARSTSTLVGKGSGSCVSDLVDVDDGQLAERLDRRARRDLRGDLDESPGPRRLRPRDHHGRSAVGVFADALLERLRPEEGNAEPFRRRLCTTVAEDLVPVPAIGAHVPAHVLDESEWRHV